MRRKVEVLLMIEKKTITIEDLIVIIVIEIVMTIDEEVMKDVLRAEVDPGLYSLKLIYLLGINLKFD
jgi:hypothetical protein